MLLAFHNAFENDRLSDNAIDFILPTLTKELSNEFCRFVDGGAGIGGTAMAYNRILEANLDNDAKEQASIICYEPLIENFSEMSKRLAQIKRCRLRNVAIASTNGVAKFAVPNRQKGDSEVWGQGTSYDGFLDDRGVFEAIEVETVRIDDDLATPQDFVKLDLQGGELEAIKGMGRLLQDVKVLYVEVQLNQSLNQNNDACRYLAENGFTIFFDKFQFGLRGDQIEVPIKKLEKLGIRIDRMRLPNGIGMPLIFWGYIENNGRELFEGYNFTQKAKEKIKEAGIGYFQTDAICINTKYSNKIYPHFHTII